MEEEKSLFDQLRKREIPMPDPSYFEALARQTPTPVPAKPARVISLTRKLVYGSLGAAALVAIGFFALAPEAPEEVNLVAALNDLSNEEVFAYVEDHLHEFDAELIVSVLPAENVETVELVTPPEGSDLTYEPVSDAVDFGTLEQDDILDYLESVGLEETDLHDIDI